MRKIAVTLTVAIQWAVLCVGSAAGSEASNGSVIVSGHNLDATGCVRLVRGSSDRWGAGTTGDMYFSNQCGRAVEIFWCEMTRECPRNFGNSWVIGAGRGWPIWGDQFRWGACLGAVNQGSNIGGFTKDSKGTHFECGGSDHVRGRRPARGEEFSLASLDDPKPGDGSSAADGSGGGQQVTQDLTPTSPAARQSGDTPIPELPRRGAGAGVNVFREVISQAEQEKLAAARQREEQRRAEQKRREDLARQQAPVAARPAASPAGSGGSTGVPTCDAEFEQWQRARAASGGKISGNLGAVNGREEGEKAARAQIIRDGTNRVSVPNMPFGPERLNHAAYLRAYARAARGESIDTARLGERDAWRAPMTRIVSAEYAFSACIAEARLAQLEGRTGGPAQ